ncbi:MAG: malto-oligosyltrehalose synthase [Candidatus Melainabacteria bacterium GWF2_37_15]|nr:MAG: malto-oligosyltrehalose synthase [Candidatus Melainabacteria bacterium GWF2_37_15]
MHGYDIINHAELNPEIGSIQEFYDFVNTLHYYDMGLVVDIVPNHMGIGNENKWWMDVLENGQASRYASYFDIDWEPLKKELKGKILVPVLGDHYGNTLSSGQFKFHFNHETGKLTINYWEHEFPINPSSYPMFLEHRIEVLESRMGSNNTDFLEYLSIITAFKKLPEIREKNIASRRLAELCSRNQLISGFIQENLVDFRCEGNDSISCNRIHNLLEEQAYRLAYWRVSIDVVNYRRFFDVNHLIGLKTENPLVFTSTHSLILDLIEQEKIDGLRLDHPDGLLDPTNYFKTLQSEAGKRLGINFDSTEANLLGSEKLPIYVIAEKILAPFEKIPRNWAINGTVGYEFLNQLCNLMIDARNAKKFKRVYQRFIESVPNFGELVVDCKKIIMKTSLTSELSTLSNHLNRISERYYSTRDYTLNNLREALTEIIACFPVYRTYISQEQKGDKAIQFIKWAIGLAKKRTLYTDPSIFDFIEKVLLVELEDDKDSEEYRDTLKFAMEFQQYTAPLMAKGLEDTSFYRYNKLIALNEVGGEPVHFGISIKDFHNHNIRRLERTPHGMICTSTHDTKRSEDVRARLCVLSEIPDKWQEKITRWSTINQSRKLELDKVLAPDKNDEYLFYQTLLGIWPCETPNEAEKEVLITRLEDYMLKAIREAKAHTSWVNINTPYEDAIKGYIRKVLTSPENHPFWKEFLPFHKDVAHVGFLNSLFQCALKLTCPGVPDIYQGSELYKFTLVDPDNRKPVDYNYLRQKLNEVKANDLYPLESGKMKMFLTSSILNFRQKHQDIFRKGNYIPLETKGSKARNLVVFSRQFDNKAVIVVVPRLSYNMVSEATPLPAGEEVWKDTSIIIPAEYFGRKCVNIFTNQEFVFTEERINAGKILNTLPFAMLFI